MIVDYGWIQVLLDGKLNTDQYNTANVKGDTSVTGRVSYIDLVFATAKNLIYPWFTLHNEDQVGNTTSPFTYSLNANGPFTKQIEIKQDLIVGGRSLRIYVRTQPNYATAGHPTAKLRLVPGGEWNPPIWRSAAFGYDTFAVPTDFVKFRYFDNTVTERTAGTINNFTIGSLIVTLNLPPDSYPNTSFTLTGDTGVVSNFTYSFASAGPFSSALTWNVGNAVNGSSVRVYVKFNDPQDGVRRVASQLKISGSLGGQTRSANSGNFSAIAGPEYWLRSPQEMIIFRARLDAEGYVKYNLRTGLVTVGVNDDNRNRVQTTTVGNVNWESGLRGNNYEVYHRYVEASRSFPGAANPGITRAKGFRVYITQSSGRNIKRITQQPTAANDYTVIGQCLDGDDGSGTYVLGIGIEIT